MRVRIPRARSSTRKLGLGGVEVVAAVAEHREADDRQVAAELRDERLGPRAGDLDLLAERDGPRGRIAVVEDRQLGDHRLDVLSAAPGEARGRQLDRQRGSARRRLAARRRARARSRHRRRSPRRAPAWALFSRPRVRRDQRDVQELHRPVGDHEHAAAGGGDLGEQGAVLASQRARVVPQQQRAVGERAAQRVRRRRVGGLTRGPATPQPPVARTSGRTRSPPRSCPRRRPRAAGHARGARVPPRSPRTSSRPTKPWGEAAGGRPRVPAGHGRIGAREPDRCRLIQRGDAPGRARREGPRGQVAR